MKTCLIILFFYSLNCFASMDPSIEVWMGTSKNKSTDTVYEMPEFNWLDVKDEEMNFERSSIIFHHVEKALELLPRVLNSNEFKRGILDYTRKNGKKEFSRNFLWNEKDKKFSNNEILEIIFKGDEKSIPNTHHQMNLNVKMKKCSRLENIYKRKWCKGVIGHTLPNSSKWITVNWHFYKGYTAPAIVNNLVHEWIHLLGFLHGSRKTMGEEITYVAGRLAQQIAEKMMTEE